MTDATAERVERDSPPEEDAPVPPSQSDFDDEQEAMDLFPLPAPAQPQSRIDLEQVCESLTPDIMSDSSHDDAESEDEPETEDDEDGDVAMDGNGASSLEDGVDRMGLSFAKPGMGAGRDEVAFDASRPFGAYVCYFDTEENAERNELDETEGKTKSVIASARDKLMGARKGQSSLQLFQA